MLIPFLVFVFSLMPLNPTHDGAGPVSGRVLVTPDDRIELAAAGQQAIPLYVSPEQRLGRLDLTLWYAPDALRVARIDTSTVLPQCASTTSDDDHGTIRLQIECEHDEVIEGVFASVLVEPQASGRSLLTVRDCHFPGGEEECAGLGGIVTVR